MKAQGVTDRAAGVAMGRTVSQIRHARDHYDIGTVSTVRPVAEYREPDGPTLAEVFAPEASRDETDEEFLARFLSVARRSVAKAEAKKYATIRIASDVPIALCLSSDWHVSPKGTDIDGLLQMADFVAQTPGMYAVGVGDLFDNPIKHRGGSVQGIADELRMLDIIVERFRGKLMGTTSGNHDDWSKVFSGQDALLALAKRHRIHYVENEIIWTIEIVNPHDVEEVTATYTIATRHKYRLHSNHNLTHACKRWLQEQQLNWQVTPDVLAIGDNHVASVEHEQYERRDVHYVRMGSFQKGSSYAEALGFPTFRATTPCVVMDPVRDGKDQGCQVFADPVRAVQAMRGWRDVAA
jgi:hypothetical protein